MSMSYSEKCFASGRQSLKNEHVRHNQLHRQ